MADASVGTAPDPVKPRRRRLRSPCGCYRLGAPQIRCDGEVPMRLSRRELLTLGGFAVAGTTLAPSLTRAQTPKRGGTLTIRGWDPPLFDPMLTTAYRVHIPLTFTHSRLVKHKAGPSIVPGTFGIEGALAASWSQTNEAPLILA